MRFGVCRARHGARGFTLIELLVVMSIMLVITTVFLVRNSQFNSSILLRNFAYAVALSVRQAQVYGVGVREAAPGTEEFGAGFGVYFSSAAPGSFVLFADTNNDGLYGAGDTAVENFSAGRGFTVSEFCATTTGGVEQCSPDIIASLSITFRRPNPEPVIRTSNPSYSYRSATITVAAPGGATRSVSIGAAGEIAVQQTGS